MDGKIKSEGIQSCGIGRSKAAEVLPSGPVGLENKPAG